jgi:hypothetical protein
MLGKQRLLLPRASGTPALAQAATALSASARQSANGFSHQTGLPAAATAHICGTCRECGVARKIACTRGSETAFVFGGQFEAPGRGEFANQLGLSADSANEAQALAFALHRLDDIFSPSAKADYGGIYHRQKNDWVRQDIIDGAY